MESKAIINLGLVAHVDAGKTTVTEQLLYRGGVLRQAGSVDGGTAQTDFLPVERQRGISVMASSAMLEVDGVQLNIIDTPGHVDFSGEVERGFIYFRLRDFDSIRCRRGASPNRGAF